MQVLGIESTAHTFGAGVVKNGEVLSNVRRMYIPEKGGIHPREAADHHVEVGTSVVADALDIAAIDERELDLVSFSRGPGLGPCLRVGATIARVISQKIRIPILGVNHCVAHIEIGRTLGCSDPVLLYASGGNTQIIAHLMGRYRVLGETLDIGIGNMLDKFGRDIGIPFPAGPKIEMLARGEAVEPFTDHRIDQEEIGLIDLPYSVKGMDVSFSGIHTAAISLLDKGHPLPSVCRSLQETAFSMLCEVAERAMAHIGTDELLLGGGVACNRRLQEMASIMARERGGKSYAPTRSLLVDNGAMIAYLGEIMHGAGIAHELRDTVIDQRFRTDQVDVLWRERGRPGRITTPNTISLEVGTVPAPGTVLGRGAEAMITSVKRMEMECVSKRRARKGYRLEAIDKKLAISRMRNEVRMLKHIRSLGIRTPHIIDVDEEEGTLILELLRGPRVASILNTLSRERVGKIMHTIGRIAGTLHNAGIVHGDLTTSNFILLSTDGDTDLALIDPSLAERSGEMEKIGVDLRLFFEVFGSTHSQLLDRVDELWRGYSEMFPRWREAREKLDEITTRGRYLSPV